MMLRLKSETEFKTVFVENFGSLIIPRDWKTEKVEDVAKVNEKSIDKQFPYDVIEYIDIDSVEQGEIRAIQPLQVSEAPSRAQRIVRDNDSLISTVRPSLKHYVFISNAKSNTIASTGFAVISAQPPNARYLYYFLTCDPFTDYLSQIAETQTSAYPAFTPDIIKEAQVPSPPPHEKGRIATLLSWFDELIANKKKQNDILEKMAIGIFNNWFADFEPFKHDEFLEGELGKAPKGWKVDYASAVIEFDPKVSLKEGKESPFIEMEQVSTNSMVCQYDYKEFEGSGVRFQGGDTLLARITPSLENGKTAFVWFLDRNESGFGSTEFIVMRPKDKRFEEYVYLLARTQEFREQAISSMTGTSGRQRVEKEAVEHFRLLIPPIPVVEKFQARVATLFHKIILNQKEIMTLRKMREALLPVLVLGKLRVEEI